MSGKTYKLEDLLQLMAYLRTPEFGCPWDLKQNYQSIVSSTIEEAYEVVDTIEHENYAHLKEELGDLLFQIVFYSQLAQEDGLFAFPDIVDTLTKKLIARHPHVFPTGELRLPQKGELMDSEAVKGQWEDIKQKERRIKGHDGLLDDIPTALPALTRSVKLQKRAAKVGFDWSGVDPVLSKLEEELGELRDAIMLNEKSAIEEELGDLMFTVVNLCRHLKIDPETAARKANTKFTKRFNFIEKSLQKDEVDIHQADQETLEQHWQRAKGAEKAN